MPSLNGTLTPPYDYLVWGTTNLGHGAPCPYVCNGAVREPPLLCGRGGQGDGDFEAAFGAVGRGDLAALSFNQLF